MEHIILISVVILYRAIFLYLLLYFPNTKIYSWFPIWNPLLLLPLDLCLTWIFLNGSDEYSWAWNHGIFQSGAVAQDTKFGFIHRIKQEPYLALLLKSVSGLSHSIFPGTETSQIINLTVFLYYFEFMLSLLSVIWVAII